MSLLDSLVLDQALTRPVAAASPVLRWTAPEAETKAGVQHSTHPPWQRAASQFAGTAEVGAEAAEAVAAAAAVQLCQRANLVKAVAAVEGLPRVKPVLTLSCRIAKSPFPTPKRAAL